MSSAPKSQEPTPSLRARKVFLKNCHELVSKGRGCMSCHLPTVPVASLASSTLVPARLKARDTVVCQYQASGDSIHREGHTICGSACSSEPHAHRSTLAPQGATARLSPTAPPTQPVPSRVCMAPRPLLQAPRAPTVRPPSRPTVGHSSTPCKLSCVVHRLQRRCPRAHCGASLSQCGEGWVGRTRPSNSQLVDVPALC